MPVKITAKTSISRNGVSYGPGDEIPDMDVNEAQDSDYVDVQSVPEGTETRYLTLERFEPTVPDALRETALSDAARDRLAKATKVLGTDPEEAPPVRKIDRKLKTVESELSKIVDALLPLQEARAAADARMQALNEDLEELRVSIVLGEMPEDVEAQAEADLKEAEADLQKAEAALKEAEADVAPRRKALRTARNRLQSERAEALREQKREQIQDASDLVMELRHIAGTALAEALRVALAARDVRGYLNERMGKGWGMDPLPGGGKPQKSFYDVILRPLDVILSRPLPIRTKLRKLGIEVEEIGTQ